MDSKTNKCFNFGSDKTGSIFRSSNCKTKTFVFWPYNEKTKQSRNINYLGMGEGGRRRGRPCMRWKDDIKTVTGVTLSELVRAVENRDCWRQLITTITKSQPRLDGTR
ncbi:ecdysteroid UDP-glucosyltransferase [Elysia marginata]|uniref:Ecdysteroid UDP-glucosyltransferase n=1 Tax=Elysia marginata TaxID=1093978 RepID=A0AAV4H5U5_9GAST|nr:ecdysteroid UDP-glucosyltransferase [Elysia marginata]